MIANRLRIKPFSKLDGNLLIHRLGGPPSPLEKARLRASERKTEGRVKPFFRM